MVLQSILKLVLLILGLFIISPLLAQAENLQPTKPLLFDELMSEIQRYQRQASKDRRFFIIGGRKATDDEFDSVVALVDKSGKAYCTGTLITPTHVATAAHCLFDFTVPENSPIKALGYSQSEQNILSNMNVFRAFIETYLANQVNNGIHLRIKGNNQFNVGRRAGVTDTWMQFSRDMARWHSDKALEFSVNSMDTSDKAIIELTKPITAISPVPLATEDEIIAINRGDYLKALQVGYGLRQDPEALKSESTSDLEYQIKFSAAMNEKYVVDVPVNIVFRGAEDYRAGIGTPGKAACFGDSGGPTFVQLLNKEWRYFASLSRGVSPNAGCGENDPEVWTEGSSEQMKQTTDFVDVWMKAN